MLSGNHIWAVDWFRMKPVRTVYVYCTFTLVAIMLALVLRTASLIWIHDLRPMGANPWILLKGGLRMALIVAPIQAPILLLGVLSCTRRRADKRWQYVVFATIVLCFLDLFIRPVTIWTGYSTPVSFCMIVGLVPVAVLVSFLVLHRR